MGDPDCWAAGQLRGAHTPATAMSLMLVSQHGSSSHSPAHLLRRGRPARHRQLRHPGAAALGLRRDGALPVLLCRGAAR